MRVWRNIVLFLILSSALSAAPVLRLSNTVVGPMNIPTRGSTAETWLEAFNIGDGSLSLRIEIPPAAPWLTVSVTAPRPCPATFRLGLCIQLLFTMRTAGLADGVYSASVTISDPAAVDSPQVVVVVVRVGPPPVVVDEYVAPGTTKETQLFPENPGGCYFRFCPRVTASTVDGGSWLSVVVNTAATLRDFSTYRIRMAPPASMPAGTYTGTVTVDDPPSKTVVTMRVAELIATPSVKELNLRLSEGGPAATFPFVPAISLTDSRGNPLPVRGAAIAGAGISASAIAGLAFVTADPVSLPPGPARGVVTIHCNAANCPIEIPVNLDIARQGPPLIDYHGAMDNAGSGPWSPVAPGDVMIVKGQRLSSRTQAFADTVPLSTTLGGSALRVNGVAAPLYYSSAGQIAFQMPSSTAVGTALVQAERDGQIGNTITVEVAARAPRIVKVTDASNNLRDVQHPAKAGETLIVWAIGLGPTNPPVPDGAPAPENPRAVVTPIPTVHMFDRSYRSFLLSPSFAGLSPGSVGLYQVVVRLPADMPAGWASISLWFPNVTSYTVSIEVQ